MSIKWEKWHQGGVYADVAGVECYVVPSVYERDGGRIKGVIEDRGVLISERYPYEKVKDGYLYDPTPENEAKLKKLIEDHLRQKAKAILYILGE